MFCPFLEIKVRGLIVRSDASIAVESCHHENVFPDSACCFLCVPDCVGVGNLKFFLQFCVYTATACGFVLYLIVSRVIHCPQSNLSMCFDVALTHISDAEYKKHSSKYTEDSAFSFVLVVLLVMEIFIFGLFTLAMSLSQIGAVSNDETQLEQWQRERDARKMRFAPKASTPVPAAQTQQQQQQVTVPLTQPVGATTLTPDGRSVSITLPVAQPLPPTQMTRARNCRFVFVGTQSSGVAAASNAVSMFSSARYPYLQRSRWYNPIAFLFRTLLFIPSLLVALGTSSILDYLLPTEVKHEDYPKMCGYRLPAPGVQTIIDVVDTSVPPRMPGAAPSAYGSSSVEMPPVMRSDQSDRRTV